MSVKLARKRTFKVIIPVNKSFNVKARTPEEACAKAHELLQKENEYGYFVKAKTCGCKTCAHV